MQEIGKEKGGVLSQTVHMGNRLKLQQVGEFWQ